VVYGATVLYGANRGSGDRSFVIDTGKRIRGGSAADITDMESFSVYYQALCTFIYESVGTGKRSEYDSFNTAILSLQSCVKTVRQYTPIIKGVANVVWPAGRLFCQVSEPVSVANSSNGDELGSIKLRLVIIRGYARYAETSTADRRIWISRGEGGSVSFKAGYYSGWVDPGGSALLRHVIKMEKAVGENVLELELTLFIREVMTLINFNSRFQEIEHKIDVLLGSL